MIFWDSTALVPLVLSEPASDRVTGWLAADPVIWIWALTRVEIGSAIERRAREGVISMEIRRAALRRSERLCAGAHEVIDLTQVRTRALPLLSRHPLRAADAIQLAAALVIAEADPATVDFATLDERLAEAAEREGFKVLL